MSPKYTGPERRQRHVGDAPVTNDDLDEALALHSEQERKHMEGLIAEVMVAFPDGVQNHREAHKAQIDAAKAQKEFWDTAKKAVVTNGVASLFALLKIIILLAALGLTVKFSMPDAAAKVILEAFK